VQPIWGNIVRTTLALGIGSAAVTAAHADIVQLSNGDTLTGKVVAQTNQGVTLDHPVLGQVQIQAERISLVTITPPTDETNNADNAEPTTPPAPQTGDDAENNNDVQAQATRAAEQDERENPNAGRNWFAEDWASKLTLGFNGSSGNTDRQDYRIAFETKFEDGSDRIALSSQWYNAYTDGNQSQNQFNASITRDWLEEDSPWFYFVKGTHRFDDRRSWQNRTSAFGGGGYTLAKTDNVEVNTRLGFGGSYEYGSVNEFTPEALFGGSVVKWNINDRASVSGETVYYPSLEDTASFRIESSVEWLYRLDMASGLSLKLGVENEYDSQTTNDNGNNELRYYGALVISF